MIGMVNLYGRCCLMAENTYDKPSKRAVTAHENSGQCSNSAVKAPHQVQFTGIVVNYNEGHYLRGCLNSLMFCRQLLVIDLGSNDASIEIAEHYGAEIIHHKRMPIVEQIRDEAMKYVEK